MLTTGGLSKNSKNITILPESKPLLVESSTMVKSKTIASSQI